VLEEGKQECAGVAYTAKTAAEGVGGFGHQVRTKIAISRPLMLFHTPSVGLRSGA
jgi:hypothetical protein